MSELKESDRFECKVINVINNLTWKGVTVEEVKSEGRVYFARVIAENCDIKPGDTFLSMPRAIAHLLYVARGAPNILYPLG